MRTYNRVYARVNLDAVRQNMEAMRQNLSPDTGMIGVVKTDGYGHGAVPVAKAIDPYVCGYATATIEEALNLRRHGIRKPVLILGITDERDYGQLIDYELRPSVFRLEKAGKMSELAVSKGKTLKIHIALDTGMSRIGGFANESFADTVKQISELRGIEIEGLFTHFARADESSKASAMNQLEQYLDFVKRLEDRGVRIPIRHCSNSAGIITLAPAQLSAVRAGISIYGLYPSDEVNRDAVALTPALELKSRITYIKEVPSGTPVSYGGTYVTPGPVRIATIPVGYGDGYPRSLSNKASVLIRGKRAAVLGRICMDQMMVDVSGIPGALEGDEVTLIGRDGEEFIPVEELSRLGGRFHYEFICDIGKRVPRVYVSQGQIIGTKDYFDDRYPDFTEG